MKQLEQKIAALIYNYENPQRISITKKYPILKKPVISLRCLYRNIKNYTDFRIKYTKQKDFFQCIIARHQSVLRRKLGDSDPKLQEQKIINLKQAIKNLNGIVIQPGNIFSFWHVVGKPTYKKGFVDGMLLSNGKILEGLGGGLCQLSNFLYWIFLHTPTEIIERDHHSMDVFPDSGRVLPFGSGATILYNLIDLKVKNISPYPIQLKIWLTDKHLKGQIRSPKHIPEKFHIFEKNHFFIKRGNQYFRYNEIYRQTKIKGKVINTEQITTNFAPVVYQVTKEYLQKNKFKVLDFTNKDLKKIIQNTS